jgi:hypothetical protein
MLPRSRGAIRPRFARTARPKQRAQGMPGARCARSRACRVENTRVSHHGHTGSPGIPRAMVLTVSFALSPVTGLCCHRHQRKKSRQLDASVGASGPHDFTVRVNAARLASLPRPPHPAPNVRDDREAPLLGGRDDESIKLFLANGEMKYFCEWDWTTQIRLNSLGKSGFTFTRIPGLRAGRAEPVRRLIARRANPRTCGTLLSEHDRVRCNRPELSWRSQTSKDHPRPDRHC